MHSTNNKTRFRIPHWRLGALRIRTQLAVLAVLTLAVILLLVGGARYGMNVATQELSTVYRQHAVPMGVYGTSLDLLHRSRMRIVLAMESSYARQAQEHFDATLQLEQDAMRGLEDAFALLSSAEDLQQVETFKTDGGRIAPCANASCSSTRKATARRRFPSSAPIWHRTSTA